MDMVDNSTYPVNVSSIEEFMVFPFYIYAVFGTIGSIITILTVFGNALTILSYLRDEKLHSVYSTYIFNLAIADFILGSIVLPIYLAHENGSFSLNYYFCKVFLVIDFTVCVEGVFMMIIISYDRLMLLRCGASYNHHETKTKCILLIVLSWGLSFFIYAPSIMFWDIWYGEDINKPGICDVQFAHHFIFTTTTAVLEFFIPLILLMVVNCCIITELRKRTRLRIVSIFRRSVRRSVNDKNASTKSSLIPTTEETSVNQNSIAIQTKESSITSENKKTQTDRRKRRERKAVKSLGILSAVFFITWAPYTVYTIVKSIREGDIEVLSYEALTWFLWLKSAVNPFLYAFNSKRYRRNFKYYLCCVKNISIFRTRNN